MTESWIKELKTIVEPERLLPEEPMSRHTTFRIGGPAQLMITPDLRQLPEVVAWCRGRDVPYTVIGNGSNLLVGDGGVRGVVIALCSPAGGIELEGNVLTAEAGALLSKTAHRAAEAGLTGMEFAAGIPGSLGGAVVMNAGAYGGEMKDIVASVQVLTPEGEVVWKDAADMEFGYRHSAVMESGDIVLAARLVLQPGDPEKIRQRMDELRDQRVSKQPLEYPSAGSTFKRPEGYYAGKLIMDAGLRGFRVGDAQVAEKHCGFVVNRGHATAREVDELMREVRRVVMERFGVELEPEVRRIGEF